MNHRRYERVPFFCRVELATDGRKAIAAEAIDISLGGVGVCAQASLPKGEPVTVTFFLKNRRMEPVVEGVGGQVANMRADEDGNRIGIEFLAPLRDAACPELMRRIVNL